MLDYIKQNPLLVLGIVGAVLLMYGDKLKPLIAKAWANKDKLPIDRKTIGMAILAVVVLFNTDAGKQAINSLLKPQKPDETKPVVVVSSLTAEQKKVLSDGFATLRADARVWAGLLAGLARAIEQDATKAQPRIVTVGDLNDLRLHLIATPAKPVQGGPVVGAVLASEFAKVGEDPSIKLDPAKRKSVVESLNSVAQHLENL